MYALQKDDQGLPIRVTGALLKKGGSRRGRRVGGRRNWSKRYFVLDINGGRLRYYEDAKLLQLAGSTMLLPTSEVVVDERPKLRGRHAPVFEGEDPYYLELRNTTDDKGRPRPYAFALRAFNDLEFADWSRSLQFCVKTLQRNQAKLTAPPKTKKIPFVVTFAEEGSLGLALILTQDRVSGQRYVVCDATYPDRNENGAVAARDLRPGDELLAILPEDQKVDDVAFYENPTEADFQDVTAAIRDAVRPLSLLFRRRTLKSDMLLDAPDDRSPAENTRALDHDDLDDVETCADDDNEDDDDDVRGSESFYCFDEGHEEYFNKLTIEELQAKWDSGVINGTSKVFVDEAWVPIDDVPKLRDRLVPPTREAKQLP